MKTIKIEDSKYCIKYDPAKAWDYHIYRYDYKYDEMVTGIQPNFTNDMVLWIIENLEAGIRLKGFTLIED